ncbi:MAG TPA: hypothetical protein VKB41_01135 [Steroidobacteraceae bacterium]|jgi:hypothetical protein|nr:hypothetical protein [Steroidobacteraceae bacterium]
MTGLDALWLPILVSAVIVFVASSIIHMGPFWHRGDYPKVPDQDRLQDALRPFALPPGDYLVPRAGNMKEMRTPEFMEKLTKGPVVLLTVFPKGPFSMGRNLAQWFVYLLIVSLFTAYITGRALSPGTDYPHVFQIAGATAFVGYSLALIQQSIWYRRAWTLTLKVLIDGFIYGLLAAGTFGWLWPH